MYTDWLSNTYCSSYDHHASFSPEPVPQPVTGTQVSQVTTNSNLRKFYIFFIFITFIFITFIPSPEMQGKSPHPLLSACWGSAVTLLRWLSDPQHLTTLPNPCPQTTSCFMLKSNTNTGHTHTTCKDLSMDEWQTRQRPCRQSTSVQHRESTGHMIACSK